MQSKLGTMMTSLPTSLTRLTLAASGISLLLLASNLGMAQQTAQQTAQETAQEPAQETAIEDDSGVSTSAADTADTEDQSPLPRQEEAPLEASSSATNNYQPTESISEDRSVSFPVDI